MDFIQWGIIIIEFVLFFLLGCGLGIKWGYEKGINEKEKEVLDRYWRKHGHDVSKKSKFQQRFEEAKRNLNGNS